MSKFKLAALLGLFSIAMLAIVRVAFTYPSVFPTGTTIYYPEKTWNGYTIHDAPVPHGAVLIDMNGNVVKQWKQITSVPGPFRILPGGYVMGGDTPRRPN
ncbi:MAG: hypothetical protein GKR91_18135 [Pseudomonadales bacterium]|nr:hypothetical protein [Pseudomonadales bacterium]